MKKSLRVLVTVCVILCLFLSYMILNYSYATTSTEPFTSSSPYHLVEPKDYTEFNCSHLEDFVVELNSGKNVHLKHTYDISKGNIIPVKVYDVENSKFVDNGWWSDGRFIYSDATNMKCFSQVSLTSSNTWYENASKFWYDNAKDIIYVLADELNISEDDITVVSKITTPKIEGYIEEETSYEINSITQINDEVREKIEATAELNREVERKIKDKNQTIDDVEFTAEQQIITVTATTKQGAEYKLVIGNDNNFYLLNTKEAPVEKPEEKPEEKPVFDTTLEYSSTEKGKMDGDTYLPPYYENEDSNAKKDLDVIVTIKSTTKEGIKSTNGVDLNTEKSEPNSEGWYYLDVKDTTVIAKTYPFDKYDNTTDNGMVNETVKLVGMEGGEDTQKPSIKWTFRRINKEEKEDNDGNITVTITYNLPLDKEKIPEGWSPVYDEDGKTIHKITKTIKKGEDYDKDVIVKQEGTDATVTTPVKKVWEKTENLPDKIIQAGATSFIIVISIIGTTVFAISRYRKIK